MRGGLWQVTGGQTRAGSSQDEAGLLFMQVLTD